MLKALFGSILCLALFGALITGSFASSPNPLTATRGCCEDDFDQTSHRIVAPENDYQSDINQLDELRSQPLDELIALSNQLEAKWRRIGWNQYAGIMKHVCSEISNRGLNDERVREQSEHFARIALSHSDSYLWEHESTLVGALGYQRSNTDDNAWLRERREKTEFWLHALRRLEMESDPSFDINDRKNLPSMRVYPLVETNLPAGSPPSAIKDPRLRRKYEVAIIDNNRKAERVNQQFPLLLYGPSFKERAERWLIQAYSQPPFRTAELKRYLQIYVQDDKTRQRILSGVEQNSK